MSHFSLLVRVPYSDLTTADPDSLAHELNTVLEQMLLPYKEYGAGNEDPEELDKYLVFKDTEEEMQKEYREGTTTMVQEKGRSKLFHAYDRKYETYPVDFTKPRQYEYPEGSKVMEMPFHKAYETFEEFASKYHGSRRDPKTGKYGYWHNPNDKWDWWTIGGRWSDHIPVLGDKHVDFCPISDIDHDAVRKKMVDGINNFWQEWLDFCNGKAFKPFDGPRETALEFGMITCKNQSELTGEEWKTIPWRMREGDKEQRYDVLKNVTLKEVSENFMTIFSPLACWAYLDKDGWKERGKMGWWGMNDANENSMKAYNKAMENILDGGDKRDWIVVVDCHT